MIKCYAWVVSYFGKISDSFDHFEEESTMDVVKLLVFDEIEKLEDRYAIVVVFENFKSFLHTFEFFFIYIEF